MWYTIIIFYLCLHWYVHVKFAVITHTLQRITIHNAVSLIVLYSFRHIFFHLFCAYHELEKNEKYKNNKQGQYIQTIYIQGFYFLKVLYRNEGDNLFGKYWITYLMRILSIGEPYL